MTDDFPTEVQNVLGQLLAELGFSREAIDDHVDEGGRRGSVVYYRSSDCKMQVYRSSREGSINCMIAPVDAPNTFGTRDRSGKWQYLTRFTPAPDVPLEELLREVTFDPETDVEQLEWVKVRIIEYYDAAHAGILAMFGNP